MFLISAQKMVTINRSGWYSNMPPIHVQELQNYVSQSLLGKVNLQILIHHIYKTLRLNGRFRDWQSDL